MLSEKASEKEYIEKGEEFLKGGNLEEAARIYRVAKRLFPHSKKILRRNAEIAMKEHKWLKGLKGWYRYSRNFPNDITGYIGTLEALTQLDSVSEAASFFADPLLAEKNDLFLSSVMEDMEAFSSLLTQGQYQAAAQKAEAVYAGVMGDPETLPGMVSWRFYMLEELNSRYHKRVFLSAEERKQIFVDLALQGPLSAAIIFSPVPLRRGKFSLCKYYLYLYKKYKATCSLETAVSQIEAVLVAYQLGKYGQAQKALSLFQAVTQKSSCFIADYFIEEAYLHEGLGNRRDALAFFQEGLQILPLDTATKRVWLDSFVKMADFFEAPPAENFANPAENAATIPPYHKIFIAGMGWSGSGALYDYFKEFSTVDCAITWELALIEQRYGLGELYKSLTETQSVRKDQPHILFAKHLFGYTCADSWEDVKYARSAKKLVLDLKETPYAISVNQFIGDLKEYYHSPDQSGEGLRRIINAFFDRIISHYQVNPLHHVLLDNVIHGMNLHLLDLFENASIFVMQRDPRSQYVSNYYENPRFHKNVKTFITDYKSKHTRLAQYAQSNPHQVEVIQFEDFVLREDYRRQLAQKAGLAFSEQQEHRYFKPWESEKNVVNYEEFPHAAEIRRIEQELNQYLYPKPSNPGQGGLL